jgi:hypothetical protein
MNSAQMTLFIYIELHRIVSLSKCINLIRSDFNNQNIIFKLHDRIMLPTGTVWIHTTGLTPSVFIEMFVPIQESKRLCI